LSQYGAYLRHSFTDQNSRHDGPIRKMAFKEIFIERHVLNPDTSFRAVNLNDAVHEQKRIAVGKMLKNFFNVEHGWRDCDHLL